MTKHVIFLEMYVLTEVFVMSRIWPWKEWYSSRLL